MYKVIADLLLMTVAVIVTQALLTVFVLLAYASLERCFPKAFPPPKPCEKCKNGEEHKHVEVCFPRSGW